MTPCPKCKNNSKFSCFMRHASDKKKRDVFLEVARLASEDQRGSVNQLNSPLTCVK